MAREVADMQTKDYECWFRQLTGFPDCYPWQRRLGECPDCVSRIIRVPTGSGKTEGVLGAWAYHRLKRNDSNWPRRLVWCLPMRVLVEQTAMRARRLLSSLPEGERASVHVLMGGEETERWYLRPERPAVLIGTQDMLLSRALNRGFASGRARWPMEFGLLNQDALWVMDEVQLMDVGLITSVQLQSFRESDEQAQKCVRPCRSWWMSATLQEQWFQTPESERFFTQWRDAGVSVPEAELESANSQHKTLGPIVLQTKDAVELAELVEKQHSKLTDEGHGRITLVVCNTVERATATFDELRKIKKRRGGGPELRLVHGRFRFCDRERWTEFLNREACHRGVDRIIVATQVIEAGVDMTAGCLVTEAAPWANLVQRFGRCARYGGRGKVIVVKCSQGERWAAPYSESEVEAAWEALKELEGATVGDIEKFERTLDEAKRLQLYPYAPQHLLLREDWEELFDTTPDLSGADIDVSRYIRSGEDRDVFVFWKEVAENSKPEDSYSPSRHELCPVAVGQAREWLFGRSGDGKLTKGKRAWVWDYLDGDWTAATARSLRPGCIVCVGTECGGYDEERGFQPKSQQKVEEWPGGKDWGPLGTMPDPDNASTGEALSVQNWKTIATHSKEVAEEAQRLANALCLSEGDAKVLKLAAYWHDWGKAHPAFQGAIRCPNRPQRNDLAKAPEEAWLKPRGTYKYANDSDSRPGFRHELASALGLLRLVAEERPGHPLALGRYEAHFSALDWTFPIGKEAVDLHPLLDETLKLDIMEFHLLAYIVASHHGKVRLGLQATPKDQENEDRDGKGIPVRGVREEDRLPETVMGAPPTKLREVSLSLSPCNIGLSPVTGASWTERMRQLVRERGEAVLGYLEAVFRAADARASQSSSNDPLLKGGHGNERGCSQS